MAFKQFARCSVVAAMLCLGAPLAGQRTPPIIQDPQTIPLWPGKAPGALGEAPADIPTLTIYMPPNTTGPMTAVIIAPGGGYVNLAMSLEGRLPAGCLNTATCMHRGGGVQLGMNMKRS